MESLTKQLEEAIAHHRAGRRTEAEAIYHYILARQPENADALQLLGTIEAQRGRLDAAIALMGRAIAINPHPADWHANLAAVYLMQRRLDPAIAAARRAVGINPQCAEGYLNLGSALSENSQWDEALAAFERVAALRPDWSDPHSGIGVLLKEKGRLDAAIASFRRALSLNPNHAEAHWNLALALLLQGNLSEGWREFEWRLKIPQIVAPEDFSQPRWDGGDLHGKTILAHDEQGFGDTLQFARYLPMLAQRGGKIILGCETLTARLLQAMPGIERMVTKGQPMPAFDVHVPLLSLPLIFGTTLATVPAAIPYMSAPAEEVEKWRRRMADGGRLRVGVVWAGRPTHRNDARRSMRLSQFAPLAEAESISFYSLQKGEAARESADPPSGMQWTDWTAELDDFAHTAGLVANLDLVICVDTAVAHLAGAMGKPVWVLLPFVPDWRWMMNREDSPWYPTMRLFRQTAAGDWEGVIRRVALALGQYPRKAMPRN